MRKLAGQTQVDLAEKMGITQSALSQLENKSDMQIASQRRLVSAIGGELELHVKYGAKDLLIRESN